MRVASGLIGTGLVGVGILVVALGCGGTGPSSSQTDEIRYLINNSSSGGISVTVSTRFDGDNYTVAPNAGVSNEILGSTGDSVSIEVVATGATGTGFCFADSTIVSPNGQKPPGGQYGQINVAVTPPSVQVVCAPGGYWK